MHGSFWPLSSSRQPRPVPTTGLKTRSAGSAGDDRWRIRCWVPARPRGGERLTPRPKSGQDGSAPGGTSCRAGCSPRRSRRARTRTWIATTGRAWKVPARTDVRAGLDVETHLGWRRCGWCTAVSRSARTRRRSRRTLRAWSPPPVRVCSTAARATSTFRGSSWRGRGSRSSRDRRSCSADGGSRPTGSRSRR